MLRQIFSLIRGIVSVGVIQSVDDTGQAQTVNVKTVGGRLRTNIEVQQIFGLASRPPVNGGLCVILAVGADHGNLVALPLSAPAMRFGNQAPGEATLYALDGTRVAVRAGGQVEIWGGTSVTVHTKSMLVNAPEGCTINGAVTIVGDLTLEGNLGLSGDITAV